MRTPTTSSPSRASDEWPPPLDEAGAAAAVYELLRPHAGLWIIDGIACCWGPVDLELGRLAVTSAATPTHVSIWPRRATPSNRQAGFSAVEVLPIEHDMFRFYQLVA